MIKKAALKILICGALLNILTGCGTDSPSGEMVDKGAGSKSQESDLQAGSSYVENDKGLWFNDKKISLEQLQENVKGALKEKYLPDISLSEEELEEKTGITKDMYEDFLAQKQEAGSNIDMMILIHAKEDYVGTIEQKLEEYRDGVIEANLDHLRNLGKAKASRMETIENYVCFVQLGADTSAVADKGENDIIAFCQEDNERAIDILEKSIFN